MNLSSLPAGLHEHIGSFLSDCAGCAKSPQSLCDMRKCPVCKDCERHIRVCDHCKVKVCDLCIETGDFSYCYACGVFFCGKCISLRTCTDCSELFCFGCSAPGFDDDVGTCNSCIHAWEEREIMYMRELEEDHYALSPSTMDYIRQVQEMIAEGGHSNDDDAYEFDEVAYNAA